MLITISRGQEKQVYSAGKEQTILSFLQKSSYTTEAPCGGKGKCLKCMVTVSGMVSSVDDGKIFLADHKDLLACRYFPAGNLEIILNEKSDMVVVSDNTSIPAAGEGLGLSVDIGTTTVAVSLYNLSTGSLLGSLGEKNHQGAFGADVISRITCCTKGQLPKLCSAIREQITEMACKLCEQCSETTNHLRIVSIAGNTTMQTIFAGMNPGSLGIAPFTLPSTFGDIHPAALFLKDLNTTSEIFLSPCIGAHVGGDISAGLWAKGASSAEGLWLYIDVGTNGEIALGNKNGYLCCATAAGPAFEGAEISCGTTAAPGAIDKVWEESGNIRFHVLGDVEACGICGSGILDAVAVLRKLEIIDEYGRLLPADELPESYASSVFTLEDDSVAFSFTEKVFLSAKDVRKIQLAKAAIRAGAETLLQLQKLRIDDISQLIIAGGFGSYINPDSAEIIGLFPHVPKNRISFVGNASEAGAAMALIPDKRKELLDFTEKCHCIDLSAAKEFSDNYMKYINLSEEEEWF